MKDFSKYEVSQREWSELEEAVASGAIGTHNAFGVMTRMILRHFEANIGEDGKVPRGIVARLKELFTIKGFTENKGNAKSYVGVAFNIAFNLANKRQSPVLNYIWNEGHFDDLGDQTATPTLRGAPLYSSSRIGACLGKFNAKDDTPFEVTGEGILVNGEPWASLTVSQLREVNKNGTKNPKVAATLRRVLGNPDRLDKEPGELGKVVKNLLKDNESLRAPAIKALADNLMAFLVGLRGKMQVILLEAEEQAIREKRLAALRANLDRQAAKGGAPITDQKVLGGEVVAPTEDAIEEDEAFQQLEEDQSEVETA